jgi:alkylated DNA repair dioxygenase AlkB
MTQAALFDAAALPPGFAYAEAFLSEAEERSALEGIARLELQEARYKEFTARRRVASFGAGYDFDANELTPAPVMAPFLEPLRDKAARWAGVDPLEFNYALVAEYRPGTQLGWHRDVPQFEAILGISLGSACTMRLRRYPPRPREPIFTLALAPRSVYALHGEARWGWQHAIAPTPDLRYSLTFRSRRRPGTDPDLAR